jgi:hypothetical protein
MLNSCENQSKVNTAERTINVQLNISSVPEKNLKLYVAKGNAASYQKIGDNLYKPENIEYSSRKSIGKTPIMPYISFRKVRPRELSEYCRGVIIIKIRTRQRKKLSSTIKSSFHWITLKLIQT